MQTGREAFAQLSDHELVVRHRAGEEDAFVEIYRRYHPQLVQFARARFRDPHQAEEIAQEALIRAYLSLDRLQPPYRLGAWLRTIAVRVAVDLHRRRQRLQPTATIDLGPDPSGEEAWADDLLAEDVQAALSRICARHREVLVLQAWGELSYDEIADRLSTPVTTIAPLLQRARQALRREYLAVTGPTALVPWLGGVPSLWRRFRDRLTQTVQAMPDLSAPFAGVMFTVAAVVTPMTTPPAASSAIGFHPGEYRASSFDHPPPSAPPGMQEHATGGSPAMASAFVNKEPLAPDSEIVVEPPRRVVIKDVAGAGPDSSDRERAQEYARQMPIYVEIGDGLFAMGADPDAMRSDIEDTLAGGGAWDWDPEPDGLIEYGE